MNQEVVDGYYLIVFDFNEKMCKSLRIFTVLFCVYRKY